MRRDDLIGSCLARKRFQSGGRVCECVRFWKSSSFPLKIVHRQTLQSLGNFHSQQQSRAHSTSSPADQNLPPLPPTRSSRPELQHSHNLEAASLKLIRAAMSRNISHGRGGAGKSIQSPDQRSNSDRDRTQATSPANSQPPHPATSSPRQSSRMSIPPAAVARGTWSRTTPDDRRLHARARTLSRHRCGQSSTPTTLDEVWCQPPRRR